MDTSREYYPVIVLGSTFAGLGAAYANKENTLVIDRSALVGYEFINSYRPGEAWNDVALSGEGMGLKEELLQRNILSEQGKVHIPAVAPVLYNRIKEDGLHVLFLTDIVEICSTGDGYELQVYNTSGFRKIKTDRIVDTRADNIPQQLIKGKSIHAMLHCEDENVPLPGNNEQAEFLEGKQKGEVILRFFLDAKDDWASARAKLHRFWMNRPEEWKSWVIAAVASTFDIAVEKGPGMVDENWCWLPSSAYSNPLAAFEAGMLQAGREWK